MHVVLDNVSTHNTPAVQRWLNRHPRFTFHFTPTYILPSDASRSAILNMSRVNVLKVVTSCARRPLPETPGTRTQHTTSAFPISNAATRSTMSSRSTNSPNTLTTFPNQTGRTGPP